MVPGCAISASMRAANSRSGTPRSRHLRRDAGDEAGLRVGQVVVGGLAVQHQRLADLVQLGIGADGGKLRRPVAPGVGAKGFVVVPEEGVGGHAWQKWEGRFRRL
jgi:hypothetical protein